MVIIPFILFMYLLFPRCSGVPCLHRFLLFFSSKIFYVSYDFYKILMYLSRFDFENFYFKILTLSLFISSVWWGHKVYPETRKCRTFRTQWNKSRSSDLLFPRYNPGKKRWDFETRRLIEGFRIVFLYYYHYK